MSNERKFNEKILLKYKETNVDADFNAILEDKDIKKYITYVCNSKLKNSPTTLYSLEDMLNIAYLILWQCIHKYNFICPCCNLQAKTLEAYKLHCTTRHGQFYEPAVSISRFVKFNLGAYLQNEIRREYSLERKSNVLTINIFTPTEEDETKGRSTIEAGYSEYYLVDHHSVEDDVVFEHLLEEIKSKFDALTKMVFDLWFNERLKQKEIATKLYNEGKYSSEQSAAVVVSRILKQKVVPTVQSVYHDYVH